MAALREQINAAVLKGSGRVWSNRSVYSDVHLLIKLDTVLSSISIFVYKRSFLSMDNCVLIIVMINANDKRNKLISFVAEKYHSLGLTWTFQTVGSVRRNWAFLQHLSAISESVPKGCHYTLEKSMKYKN